MSALTSSPSPAASPRLSYYTSHPSPRQTFHTPPSPSTSRPSSRHQYFGGSGTASPGSRRAFHVPTSTHSLSPSTTSKDPYSSAVVAAGEPTARPSYVHTGTQYSPDGLPPTARRKATASGRGGTTASGTLAGGEQQPNAPGSGVKKRKERDGRQNDSPSMNVAEAPSQTATPPVPQEPDPRRDPTRHSTPVQVDGSRDGRAQHSLQRRPPEVQAAARDDGVPQEARSTSSAPKRQRGEPGAVKIMPVNYAECSPKDLGVLISGMLMELIRLNDRIPLQDNRLTRFHSRAAPGISVSDYLQRLIQHATLSPPILLSTVFYIDRLCAMYPAFTINSLTVHRFLITAATVAAKGLSDSFWTNPTYARIGGIPVSELATLELDFLQKVQWKIVPDPEALESYYVSLVDRADGYELEKTEGQGTASSAASSADSIMSSESDAVSGGVTSDRME